MSEPLSLSFDDGALGRALGIEGEILRLVANAPFAPGQPLSFTLSLPEGTIALQGKSLGSKRRPDDQFELRARLVSLRRADRERLQALFTPPLSPERPEPSS